jgi:O-methyltransferase
MDWTVRDQSSIGRLPAPLKRPALAARNALENLPGPARKPVHRLLGWTESHWPYDADGMATSHFSPFFEDREWNRRYDEMSEQWYTTMRFDARWRLWLLTRFAAHARNLEGNFAEFGVYRGGCSRMVLGTIDLQPERRLYLFDTYAGTPDDDKLAEDERDMGGRHADTSADYVADLLSQWDPIPVICKGDVFDTIPATETGPLAFVHLDLNAAAPTRHVLEHIWDRLVPGAVIVFDDYGWDEYIEQRHTIDDFLADRPEQIIALPTGTAAVFKAPASAGAR